MHLVARFEKTPFLCLQQRSGRLELLRTRLAGERPDLQGLEKRLEVAQNHLFLAYTRQTEKRCDRLNALKDRLQSVDVRRVLERGFCLVREESGRLCSRVSDLSIHQDVRVVFSDGNALACIKEIGEKK